MINLSFSAAQRYLQSPMAYLLHYLFRLRPAQQGSPLVFGGAIDIGLNSLLEDKKHNRPLDVEKAKQAFEAAFTKQTVNGKEVLLYEPGVVKFSKSDLDTSLLTDEDRQSGRELAWCALRRKGMIIIEEYAAQVIPRLEEVILIQHEVALPNELGDKIVGFIDILAKIDGKIYICDNKTSSIRYDQNSANESPQLATYYEALKDEYDIAGVAFITIPKRIRKVKKPPIDIEIIFGEIKEELLEQTFAEYERVLSGIKAGDFRCSGCRNAKFGCDYKRYCESQGRDLTGLVKVPDRK